ncbi:chemotaxis protein CheW [Roseobacteraceae bacterium S113]
MLDNEGISESQTLDEVVAFSVAGQDFCCPIMSVREIRGWSDTTTLPCSPAFIRGVINLRGAVVPVIDLAERLGLGQTLVDERKVIIIAVVNDQTVGLLADVVSDIVTLEHDAKHPVPDVSDASSGEFIAGIILQGDRIVRQLELTKILPNNRFEDAC